MKIKIWILSEFKKDRVGAYIDFTTESLENCSEEVLKESWQELFDSLYKKWEERNWINPKEKKLD